MLDGLVRLFRGQGQDPDRRYWFPVVGYNYRMTNVAAAIGLGQLESVDLHLAQRRRIADAYDETFKGGWARFRTPATRPDYVNVSWLYTIVLDDDVHIERDTVIQRLADAGIESRPVFYPMHVMPVFRRPVGSFPVAERLGARGISLPTHAHLTAADIERVASTLRMALS
jgi:perosamine synthetase